MSLMLTLDRYSWWLEAEAEPMMPLLAASRPILSCFGKGCMAKVFSIGMVRPLRTPERAELP